ncbi:uncharacterized protein M6D78_003447 isoform 1-T1 [Vipera latastei]
MQRGPRRLEVSLSLALPPGPPRFGDQNEVRRGLYLRMQLGLSLVSAHDGFQTAAHLQIQAGNHGIGDQGGSLLAWNFNCLLQWTRWIQRHSISYYALRLFSNWWRIPGGLQLSSDFQGRFPNFVVIIQGSRWLQVFLSMSAFSSVPGGPPAG